MAKRSIFDDLRDNLKLLVSNPGQFAQGAKLGAQARTQQVGQVANAVARPINKVLTPIAQSAPVKGFNQAGVNFTYNNVYKPAAPALSPQNLFPKQRQPIGQQFNNAMGLAQGAFSLAYPLQTIAMNSLGAVAKGIKNKQTPGQIVSQVGKQEPSTLSQGLGINNPFIALPLDIVAGGPRGALNGVKNIKTIGTQGKKIANQAAILAEQDAKFIPALRDTFKKTGTLGVQDTTRVYDLASKYLKIPNGRLRLMTTDKILAELDGLMNNNQRFSYQELPGLGFVGKNKFAKSLGESSPVSLTPKLVIGKGSQELAESPRIASQHINPQGTEAFGSTMNLPKSTEGKPGSTYSPQVSSYLDELQQKQKQAGSTNLGGGLRAKAKGFVSEIKEKFVDKAAPIEDVLSEAERKNRFSILPKSDVRLQIDRVLRARTLAGQFAEDNGLTQVIKDAPDLNALDQYLIAKQSARVEQLGIKTGRDLARDQQLIAELGPNYESHAQVVTQYSQKLLDYITKSGLIDPNLAAGLKQKYPEYVPLNRIFDELEKSDQLFGSKGLASLSKQTVVQKIKGSEREIASPIESLLLKTQQAFEQGERNVAAKQLASYKSLPGFEGLVRELKDGERATHTFSYIDNGVKRTFETTPEIATAAKNLNAQQLGIIGQILAIPTRALQLGATGINVGFAIPNLAKDQMTAFINSDKALRTSVANPKNFLAAFFSAIKHDDLYKEMVRQGGGGTSFDIARNAPNLTVNRIRASRSVGSRIRYTVTHPGELLRALENTVGRSEELGRVQQFRGTREALLSSGRTVEDAAMLGAKAARNNTANFARNGSWGQVVKSVIPYFNAGIQGSRAFVRSAQNNPKGTAAKLTVGLFMPVAGATLWNISDPERKRIYDDIDDFEKQGNIILIPPGATMDEKKRYNVIKIPLPPGLSNLTALVRRPIEAMNGLDPVRVTEIANNLFTAGTSLDVSSPNKVLSTFTPQALKGPLESFTNTNLYTGKKIVPDYLQDLPPGMQSQDWTSPVAKKVGETFNISPLKIENFMSTTFGGVGSQVIGRDNPVDAVSRRFTKASGGRTTDAQLKEINSIKSEARGKSSTLKNQAEKLDQEFMKLPKDQANAKLSQLKVSQPDLYEKLKDVISERKLNLTQVEKSIKNLGVNDGARARYIHKEIEKLKTREEKNAKFKEWQEKKIITDEVRDQIRKLRRGEL